MAKAFLDFVLNYCNWRAVFMVLLKWALWVYAIFCLLNAGSHTFDQVYSAVMGIICLNFVNSIEIEELRHEFKRNNEFERENCSNIRE